MPRSLDIACSQLADFAVLTKDYLSVSEEEIKSIESALTVVGGQIVYATGDFSSHAPPAVPVMPDALDDVKDTVPLKPLKPCALIVVEESELPADIVTLVWLRVMLKPAGAIFTGMVTEWVTAV